MQSGSAVRASSIALRVSRGPWFLAALLLAMASALVPALLPSSGPARTLGSAFDPTTNVLALRVREQTLRIEATRSGGGDAARPPSAAAPLPAAAPGEMVDTVRAYPAGARLPAYARAALPPPPRGPAQPRAPPSAA